MNNRGGESFQSIIIMRQLFSTNHWPNEFLKFETLVAKQSGVTFQCLVPNFKKVAICKKQQC